DYRAGQVGTAVHAGGGAPVGTVADIAQAAHVDDLDAVDALHRPYRLLDDLRQATQQFQARLERNLLGAEGVARLVDGALAFGIDAVALFIGLGADAYRLRLARCRPPHCFRPVFGSLLFRIGRDHDGDGILLRLFARLHQPHRLGAFGNGRLADLLDLFLGRNRLRQFGIGSRLGRGLLLRLLRHRDFPVLFGDAHRTLAL